jgi:hypothetical protein
VTSPLAALVSLIALAGGTAGCVKSAPTTPRESHGTSKRPVAPTHGEVRVERIPSVQTDEPFVRTEPDEVQPVPTPALGPQGCMTSEEARTFGDALEAANDVTYRQALDRAGYELVARNGRTLGDALYKAEVPVAVGAEYSLGGRRLGVVAVVDRSGEVPLQLARRDGLLYVPSVSARTHSVTVRHCGANPCHVGQGTRVPQYPVVLELADDERMGGSLGVEYDAWLISPEFETLQDCGPPPP